MQTFSLSLVSQHCILHLHSIFTVVGTIHLRTKEGAGEIAQCDYEQRCSSSRSGFESQHPHGGSQSPETPSLGDLMASSGLQGHWAYTGTQTYESQHTPHIKISILKNKEADIYTRLNKITHKMKVYANHKTVLK